MSKNEQPTNSGNKIELVLNTVNKHDFDVCVNLLNSGFRSTDLEQLVGVFRRWLSDKVAVHVLQNGTKVSCVVVASYFIKKRCCKEDSLKFLATFLADKHNCHLMLEAFPAVVYEVMRRCTEEFFVPVSEVVEMKDGNKIIAGSMTSRYYHSYELNNPWFCTYRNGGLLEETCFVTVHLSLLSYLYAGFHPEVDFPSVKELPKKENLHVTLTEKSVVRAYPWVQKLYEEGTLQVNAQGKMSVSTIKECALQLGQFDEFMPKRTEKGLKNLRATLFFNFMYSRMIQEVLRSGNKKIPLEDILKTDKYSMMLPPLPVLTSLLLPHISGIRAGSIDLSNFFELNMEVMMSMRTYGSETKGKWIPIDGFISWILSQNNGCKKFLLFSPTDFYYSEISVKNNKKSNNYIKYSEFRKELSEPYLKGLLLMLASVGLFDIAGREYQKEDRSWVDWLEYVRLTDLGRYVFGLSGEYKPNFEIEEIEYFDVDPDHLIVRSLQKENPFDVFLSEVAKYIGNQRWVFTEESFIKKCNTKKDVESKIDFFQKMVSSNLSPVWSEFFEKLKGNCNPFLSLNTFEYSIFQVDGENKELIHLLNTDPYLRKIVVRAEGFLFLVKNSDKVELAKRMKNLGYIL